MFRQRVLYERNISDHSELQDGPQNNQFYGLKRMKLVDCNVQPYAIPSHILSYLKSLKELEVRRCHSVRVIFDHSRIVRRRSFNLQKLTLEELSMLTHVWENNHHGILCFQNLQHVSISRCGNLQSLFPAALAKNLKELESLQVERCDKLVEIVEKVEDAAADATEKFMFPRLTLLSPSGSKEKLYERTISDHRELQDGPQNNQFYGLKRMKLVNCNVQPYAIPSHILSYLNSLEELEVRGCYNVKVIFDSWIVSRGSFKLQNLTLEELSMLTHVWENNHDVILSFQNLQHVSVKKCHSLQSLFPAALAKNLKKLESLQIERCNELLKIVEKVEDAAADATEKFVFPRLTLLNLSGSQNLTCFYPETFILECPILKILSVFECDKLEVFQSNGEGSCSTSINKQPLFLDLKVISNLEKLSLDLWTDPSGRLWSKVMSRKFTAPKLQEMSIHNYRSPRIFHIQDANIAELGMLGHLKILKLRKAFNLQFIVSDDTPWLNTICEKLHELEVSNCHLLTTLIHSTSVISFSSLKKLIISNCNKVEYLFTSSVAKKLMHLEMITATSCDSMKEIVAKEQQDETTSEGIKFERLSCIELDNLSSLECFYSGNDILQFPSLKQMIIRRCLKMEFISQGLILAKSFEGIQDSYSPNDLVFHNDLNSSVKRVFVQQGLLQAMDKRCLSCHLGLQKARDHKVGLQNKWLRDLVILKLDKCFLPYTIPSCILPYLKNLKELEVRNSDEVKVIFELNDTGPMETAVKLEKLHLEGLSELTHIWEKNSQGVAMFQNLQHVIVESCDNLETLFPAALAKNLKKLKELKIESCDKLLDIVEKEEDAAVNVTENFVFPCLKILDLNDLPQFTYFYPQTFTLECPALNKLKVLYCPKLELFQSAHPEGEGEGSGTSITRQPHISYLKVISNVEELSLDWKHISALSLRLRSGQFTEGLKYLNDISLYFDADENEEPFLPTEVLQKAPNLKELRIGCCNSLKIILAQNLKIGEDGMLGLLRVFTLDRVSKLQSINSVDSSWLNAICEKLHKLNVFSCPDLTTLIQSTSAVSFSCLREMCITRCPELQYLFTSSAAKILMNIEEITVEECKSMKEIVAKEDETTSEEIRFEQLRNIYLIALSSMECFYSGNDTLQLSSLIQVQILQCPKMEIFSQGVIHAKSFRGIQSSSNTNNELVFYEDLNTSVKTMFLQQKFRDGMDEKCFSNHSELHQAWQGEVRLQNNWFYSLKTMKLVNCEFQPYAIPAHILPSLKSLEELQVRNCKKVKAIFDVKDSENVRRASSKLQKLTLEGLPMLTDVWEKNFQGILSFQNLQQVFVKECGDLKTVFPATLAKNLKKLKNLDIRSCGVMQQIIGEVEDAATGIIEKIIFPHLTYLSLYWLPQLTNACPEELKVELPALNMLAVLYCDNLELFPSANPKSEGGSSSVSINRQPLFSDLKAISNLERLHLQWKHALVLRQLEEDLKYLNYVHMIFDANENVNPSVPIEILEKAPNLQEMRIECCRSLEMFLTPNSKIGQHGMLGKLQKLALHRVSILQSIGSNDSPWLNTICEKLHELNVVSCSDLTTLIHSTSTVSFSYLKELRIVNCHRLLYLFTSSTTKMLMHLELITIQECDSMKEIVAKEQGEITSDGIKFERIYMIVLSSLSNLKCFYSGYDTLELPSLREVKILQCPKMEIFSLGAIDAKSFEGIQVSDNLNDDLVFHDRLNFSVKRVFLLQNHLVVGDSPMLKEIWLGSVTIPDWCFRNLNSLIMESCEFLSNAILPSHLLPLLRNLKKLHVRNCNSVKSIFGHSKMINMGSEGTQSLPSLEVIDVRNCKELVEIVAKEEEATEEANQGLIIFPSMTWLTLSNLPDLRSIYSGKHILEWPKLQKLNISQCRMLNFFATEFQNSPDSRPKGQDSFPPDQQAFISLGKVTPRLEFLSLGKKEAMMIEQGKLHVDIPLLDLLGLQGFDDESDEFPFAFCSKATLPSIKRLLVFDSSFKVIFPSQTLNIIFPQLKELNLLNLPLLESIGFEHSWVHPLLRNLDALFVLHCHCLTNLIPSTVSFSNLKMLSVGNCHGLKYLFTSSTAKTLCVLESMSITNCDSIEAIVAKKGYEDEGESEGDKGEDEDEDEVEGEDEEDEVKDEGDEDEIMFGKLKYLTVNSLPKLKSFYSGCSTLNFPSLVIVSLTRCNNMQVFSYGDVLRKRLEMTIDGVSCKGDINSAIKQNFAVKRQPGKSLSGERSLLDSTHIWKP